MTVFIIAALTADGFIARNSNHAAMWTSKEDKKFFQRKTKQAGVVVMGSKTFQTIGRPLADRLNIVYTRSQNLITPSPVLRAVEDSPKTLINKLKKEGFDKVAICGGASIYSLFLRSRIVDRLYLTVESLFFGKGVNLLDEDFDTKLKLVDIKRLSGQTLLLEYEVVG